MTGLLLALAVLALFAVLAGAVLLVAGTLALVRRLRGPRAEPRGAARPAPLRAA